MSANSRQEGGTHYRTADGKPQHWDLAIMYGWDPFQYQITKYVMRWKDKHDTPAKKLEDLKKARHFLDKYIENYEQYLALPVDAPMFPGGETFTPVAETQTLAAPCQAGTDHWQLEGYFGDGTCLYSCRKCKWNTRQESAPAGAYIVCTPK